MLAGLRGDLKTPSTEEDPLLCIALLDDKEDLDDWKEGCEEAECAEDLDACGALPDEVCGEGLIDIPTMKIVPPAPGEVNWLARAAFKSSSKINFELSLRERLKPLMFGVEALGGRKEVLLGVT